MIRKVFLSALAVLLATNVTVVVASDNGDDDVPGVRAGARDSDVSDPLGSGADHSIVSVQRDGPPDDGTGAIDGSAGESKDSARTPRQGTGLRRFRAAVPAVVAATPKTPTTIRELLEADALEGILPIGAEAPTARRAATFMVAIKSDEVRARLALAIAAASVPDRADMEALIAGLPAAAQESLPQTGDSHVLHLLEVMRAAAEEEVARMSGAGTGSDLSARLNAACADTGGGATNQEGGDGCFNVCVVS